MLDGGARVYYNREKYRRRARARRKTAKEGLRYEDRLYRHGQYGRRARARRGKERGGGAPACQPHTGEGTALANAIGAAVCDNAAAAGEADHLFLGVKPQMMAGMLAGIAPVLKARVEKPVLISMAAGLTIETIQTMAGGNYPVIRIMPNMPAAVGEGVIFYACSENCEKADVEAFLSYMAPAGKLFALEEKLHDAGSAVAGCGPAFAAMF